MHPYPANPSRRSLTVQLIAKLNEQHVTSLDAAELHRAVNGCVNAPALRRLIDTLLQDHLLTLTDRQVTLVSE